MSCDLHAILNNFQFDEKKTMLAQCRKLLRESDLSSFEMLQKEMYPFESDSIDDYASPMHRAYMMLIEPELADLGEQLIRLFVKHNYKGNVCDIAHVIFWSTMYDELNSENQIKKIYTVFFNTSSSEQERQMKFLNIAKLVFYGFRLAGNDDDIILRDNSITIGLSMFSEPVRSELKQKIMDF
jgi:hypothetical protein